jgi:hypothetical protein
MPTITSGTSTPTELQRMSHKKSGMSPCRFFYGCTLAGPVFRLLSSPLNIRTFGAWRSLSSHPAPSVLSPARYAISVHMVRRVAVMRTPAADFPLESGNREEAAGVGHASRLGIGFSGKGGKERVNASGEPDIGLPGKCASITAASIRPDGDGRRQYPLVCAMALTWAS